MQTTRLICVETHLNVSTIVSCCTHCIQQHVHAKQKHVHACTNAQWLILTVQLFPFQEKIQCFSVHLATNHSTAVGSWKNEANTTIWSVTSTILSRLYYYKCHLENVTTCRGDRQSYFFTFLREMIVHYQKIVNFHNISYTIKFHCTITCRADFDECCCIR